MNELIIVSEGTEIAYAKPFAELFKTLLDSEFVYSSRSKDIKAELYSTEFFLQSSIPKKSYKIAVGSARIHEPAMEACLDEEVYKIFLGDHFAKIVVDEKRIDSVYDSLFQKLQHLEGKYFEMEAEYIQQSNRKKSQYLPLKKSVFKKNKDRIVQVYLYLAYYFYLNQLDEFIK